MPLEKVSWKESCLLDKGTAMQSLSWRGRIVAWSPLYSLNSICLAQTYVEKKQPGRATFALPHLFAAEPSGAHNPLQRELIPWLWSTNKSRRLSSQYGCLYRAVEETFPAQKTQLWRHQNNPGLWEKAKLSPANMAPAWARPLDATCHLRWENQ